MQLGRRGALAQSVAAFKALDDDGNDELSPDELRPGIARVFGRHLTEKEFAELFALVDTDGGAAGGGTVSLKEFLEGEEHFWDAG
eukprot:gene1337-16931_t